MNAFHVQSPIGGWTRVESVGANEVTEDEDISRLAIGFVTAIFICMFVGYFTRVVLIIIILITKNHSRFWVRHRRSWPIITRWFNDGYILPMPLLRISGVLLGSLAATLVLPLANGRGLASVYGSSMSHKMHRLMVWYDTYIGTKVCTVLFFCTICT